MSRWTRQPQGAVRVDRSHPFAAAYVDAFVAPSPFSLSRRYRIADIAFDRGVVRYRPDGVGRSGGDSYQGSQLWASQAQTTIVAVVHVGGVTSNFRNLCGWSSITTTGWNMYSSSTAFKLDVGTGAGLNTITGPALTTGRHILVFTYDGTTARFYVDGVSAGSSVQAYGTSSSTYFVWPGTSTDLDAAGLGVLSFSRAINDSEVASISANPWQIFKKQDALYFSTASVQLLRPTSDISPGAWTASSGSDLFAMLDETTASDADYITTSSASSSEVAFGTGLDPLSSAGHTIRFRAQGTGGLTVTLLQGATTIATYTPTITASYALYSYTLSGAEADAISDYTALRLRFTST